jgi:hypothetical protein
MNEEQVRQLIAKEIVKSGLTEKTGELREQIEALKAEQGLLTLEEAEEKIEAYVRRGMSYEQSLNEVISQLEERELEAKSRADQRKKERTEVALEETERQAALELREEEGNAD